MARNCNRRELARVRDRKFHVTQSSPYVRGEGTRDEALKTTYTRRKANMDEHGRKPAIQLLKYGLWHAECVRGYLSEFFKTWLHAGVKNL